MVPEIVGQRKTMTANTKKRRALSTNNKALSFRIQSPFRFNKILTKLKAKKFEDLNELFLD